MSLILLLVSFFNKQILFLFFKSFIKTCLRVRKDIFSASKLLPVFILFFYVPAQAVKVYFPNEELSTESVLPIVDNPNVLANRRVALKNRLEFNFGMGVGLDEAFYYSFYPTGQLSFHITEIHAISLSGLYYPPILSHQGKQLRNGTGLENGKAFDPQKAPYPQMSIFLNYQFTPFYGKISLSKTAILNLSIYSFLGGGTIISDQNDRFIAANFGIGQKLYFNQWIGLRGDLGFYTYYGPATARLNLGTQSAKKRYQDLQASEKRLNVNIIAHIGVVLLL